MEGVDDTMRYIDLSYTLNNQTKNSPFDNPLKIQRTKFIEIDHYNDSTLTTTMHIGTHIDAPSHMTSIEKDIDAYPIDQFIGRGVVLDFENEKTITLRDVDEKRIQKEDIVVIYTGSETMIGTDEYYYNHPKVSKEFCDFLIEKKVKILALDFFSPDSSPSLIHKSLLSNDILIVENVKNTKQLLDVKEFNLYMIPLKISAEGSFVRAFAEVVE